MKNVKLPETDSIQELAEFWDKHDLMEFENELEEVSEPVFVRPGEAGPPVGRTQVTESPSQKTVHSGVRVGQSASRKDGLGAKPFTKAGKDYLESLTAWLQETRLMSEAVMRLFSDYQKDGTIDFNAGSWPKPPKHGQKLPMSDFAIKPVVLDQRMDTLLKNLWATRFVFLETLWEEYLQELVQELRHQDALIFEPFCQRDFMAEIVKSVLTDGITSIEEVKNEIATRFATGITRESWEVQWKQLSRLQIGLTERDKALPWFDKLASYFEMRNCIVHLQGRVSQSLRKRDSYYADRDDVEIWPPQLDFYRHQFIACLLHIEGKFEGRFKPRQKTPAA